MVIASAGGHWIQLNRMAPAWSDCRVSYVSTEAGLRHKLDREAAAAGKEPVSFHVVPEANRWQRLRLAWSMARIGFLLLRLRPDVIVTTGAAPGYFALRLGHMMGCRTIWVDSIANAEELSLSGQMAGKHADLWLTQWEHLARPEGPRFEGSVI